MLNSLIKNIVCGLVAFQFLFLPCLAFELDLSVDDEIRKNYNPSKLELEGLPPLPNVKPSTPSKPVQSIPSSPQIEVPKTKLSVPSSKPVIAKVDKSVATVINKGTKFKVKSDKTISDSSRIGTTVSFVSQVPVTKRYITIPQGTVFKGQVVDSHTPQRSGNGGLIVIEVNSMILKGSTVNISAKITKADHKKIFLNNIKGERRYLKGVVNSIKPGARFYKKMMRTTSKLANGTFTLILTPFTVVAGVLVYTVNVVGSPLFGLFSFGGHISIPAGSDFEIKFLEDKYLY